METGTHCWDVYLEENEKILRGGQAMYDICLQELFLRWRSSSFIDVMEHMNVPLEYERLHYAHSVPCRGQYSLLRLRPFTKSAKLDVPIPLNPCSRLLTAQFREIFSITMNTVCEEQIYGDTFGVQGWSAVLLK